MIIANKVITNFGDCYLIVRQYENLHKVKEFGEQLLTKKRDRSQKQEVTPLLPARDEFEPLVDDVMSWEVEMGYFISAMKKAGVDQEKIAEVLDMYNKVKLLPYKATKLFWDFK
ncbi:hypothetical protein [Paenibacillus sp. P36]|uniref:hypothetical protein n=1 Tax=Paenibacillus sp. P36 TaxID=3342538 RepID=UPI0038B2D8E1